MHREFKIKCNSLEWPKYNMENVCGSQMFLQYSHATQNVYDIIKIGDQNQIAFATLDTEAHRDLYYFDL